MSKQERPVFQVGDRIMVKRVIAGPDGEEFPIGHKGRILGAPVGGSSFWLLRFDGDTRLHFWLKAPLEWFFAKAVSINDQENQRRGHDLSAQV